VLIGGFTNIGMEQVKRLITRVREMAEEVPKG